MANYIFKVKRVSDTIAEIVDGKVYNCQNMGETVFANYYDDTSYDVKLKKTDPDRGWIQNDEHEVAQTDENNACESIETGSAGEEYDNHSSLKLNRADGSSTLTITHSAGGGSGGIVWQAVDQASAFGNANNGLTGDSIPDTGQYLNMVAIQTTAVLKPGYWMRNHETTSQRAQITAIVKYGYGFGGNSDEYRYRIYCINKATDTQIITLLVGDGLDFSVTGDWSTGTISGADDINPILDQLSITDSFFAAGKTFYSIHYFQATNLGTAVPEVTNKYDKCSMVGVRMDGNTWPVPHATAGGLNRRLAEAHPITAVANKAAMKCDGSNPSGCANWSTNSNIEVSVSGYNAWASGDYGVEVGGTTHNEYPNPAPLSGGWSEALPAAVADVDWFKFGNIPTYYLGFKQDYMWATTTSLPPAETPQLAFNASGAACVVTVNVTALSGYSTPVKAWLVGPDDASPTIGEAIQDISFSGTGSTAFTSLSAGGATIPATNPNGTYDILFSQNGAYGVALGTQVLNHVVNICPFFDFTVAQSNGTCNLVAQLSNIHSYSSLKVKVLHYDGSAVVDGSNAAFEYTFGSLTTTGHAGPVSHTFDLSSAVGICHGDNLKVQVIDPTTSSGITMADHGNQTWDVVAWSGESGCGEASIVTAVSQADCEITGQVSSQSCVPNMSGESTKQIKAQFWKNAGGGFAHIGGSDVIKTNTFASAVTGYNLTDSNVTNHPFQVKWYYNSNTPLSPTWVLLKTDSLTVNTCPTFGGSATASTSPKCAITVTVNWGSVSNLGNTIRAVVFLDSNGDGVLQNGENVITGATEGGSAVNFASGGVNFTAGSGNEVKTIVLDGVSDPNAKYIVEFQADDGGTFAPLNAPAFGLSTADTHKAVTITNCTPCASNATPFYYFQVSSGNIVTNNSTNRGVKRCTTDAFTGFAGGYCKTDASASNWTIIGKASGGQWAQGDVDECLDGPGQADGTAITVRLYGSHLQTGQPLSVFTSGSSWTTPLADGWYIACSTTFPSPDADPCTTTYAFEINASGQIVSDNGQSGSNLRAAAFSGTFSAQAGVHTWGTGNDICYSGTSFTYEPVIHSSAAVARGSLGCEDNDGATLYLFGNAITGLYVHTANNADAGSRKTSAAGWYTTCIVPAAGTAVCATEYFLQITSAAGDWNGKIYNCAGTAQRTDATSADWFNESPWTGWTGSSVGNGWAGGDPSAAGACNLCAGNYVNVNSGTNTLYVSGTLENGRSNADKLRIYRGAALANPLAVGWYRYCGTPPVPKANGVPEYREKWNCYGNPFSWWSAKVRDSLVIDDNNYLTNNIDGQKDWWRDAPVKDLTDTNNDLGVYEWWSEGETKATTILRTTVSRSCISTHQNGGGTPQNKEVFQFTAGKKKNLSRSPFAYHADEGSGQNIISSAKTDKTEVTAALVFDTDSTSGMIFHLSDILDSSGKKIGTWEHLEQSISAGNTITESALVFRKTGSSQVTLQTQKRTLVYSSVNKSASWGGWTQTTALNAACSGFSVVVIKATKEGHSIRVNGQAVSSDAEASYFCDTVVGINNLNTEIGGNGGNLTPTMTVAEVLLYDDELNLDEIEELEGWLAERWCRQLADLSPAHPYYADGPNCSTCESQCCEAEVTVSTTVTGGSHKVEITPSYKCSESVWGYQYKLKGLEGLNLSAGAWKAGQSITTSVVGKTFSVAFSDPFAVGFTDYLVVDSTSSVWVVGHFYDGGSGDYSKVLPPQAAASAFNVVTITETSGSKVQSWGGITGTIVTSNSKLNTPVTEHPILATYYPYETSRQLTPVSTYNGDSTGDGTVKMTDVEAIVTRISKPDIPYDLTLSSGVPECWMETLDANGKGWLDITDVITTLLNLKNNGTGGGVGTPISTDAVVKSATNPKNLLSVAACINKLRPTECEPCPCPDLREPEECLSSVWISDIEAVDKDHNFAVITVKYQSSCCIDGYKIELGGYDPTKVGATGFHDGIVYAPSTGVDIGQQITETHQKNWLHGTSLDPTYSGDVAVQNGGEIWAWQAAAAAGYPLYLQNSPKTKYNFPIVWGMSIATLASAAVTGKKGSKKIKDMIRVGYGCIPPTCDGESRVLTKFVVNIRTFVAMPYIKNFRLVTNDDLVTPISFDGGSGITWTGDGADSDTTVDSVDWTEALLYMGFGWSRTTSFSNPTEQTAYRNKIKVFSAENDDGHLDVVDILTVSNHMLRHGPAVSNTASKVVPKDCCDCTLPGTFIVSAVVNPCNCWEEGYKRGKKGEVTLTWTASSNADSYTILRFIEDEKQTAQNSKGMMGWKNDNTQHSIAKRTGGKALYNKQFAANYKNQQEKKKTGTWATVAKLAGTETTWTDINPPRYEKCCPDEVLPKVIYVVQARNDCGEVSAKTSYEPKCCNLGPKAYDVDIGTRTVNHQLNFMADAYHPFASSPYGGIDKAATALVTFIGIPADNVTLKVIDYNNLAHTFQFKAGGGSSTALLTFINTSTANTVTLVGDALVAGLAAAAVKITGVNASGAVTMTQNDGSANTNKEYTICGNTKITASSTVAITLPATNKFTGGNTLCTELTPGFPAACEDLRFQIFRVKYSNPTTGGGKFVGPADAGQPLPRANRTGRWLWIPPTGYLGSVTFYYRVTNESGCEDIGKITVTYKPVKVKLECDSFPCGHPHYGHAVLKFDRPRGILGEVRILRKASTDSTAWDTSASSSQILTNANGQKVKINLTATTQDKIKYIDTTAVAPVKCCEDDLAYDYILVVCQINDYIAFTQQGKATSSVVYCTESTVCRITIPCCPKPHNPIPEVCVSDCDGVAATGTLIAADGDLNDLNQFTEGEYVIITSTDATKRVYVLCDSSESGAAATGTILTAGSDIGAGTLLADTAALGTCIAVQNNLNYPTQAAVLNEIKAAVVHANGHNGKIACSADVAAANGPQTITLTQAVVGDAGNTAITTNISQITATSFTCGFDAVDHPAARISWAPIAAGDNAFGYAVWKRIFGDVTWRRLPDQITDLQSAANAYWDVARSRFFFVDEKLKITKFCEPSVKYEYAVTAINKNGWSGSPNDTTWGAWSSTAANQGDACSPGGTTVTASLVNCPPTPCLETHAPEICIDTDYSIDLSTLVGCLPEKADGSTVAVAYSIISSAGWVSPSLDGSVLSFTTRGIDFSAVGAGPHNGAIVWRLTVGDSDCPSTTNANINITLADCGCPCPDDEKDYTICDVNYDNAEYVADSKLINGLEQIPFSIGREGSQNLRKGKPYMVSKGEIDQS